MPGNTPRELKDVGMARPQLRIYYGPEQDSVGQKLGGQAESAHRVTVPLGDVFPLSADALQNQRTWLRDFAEDEVTISTDLYEVLLAYQHYRRPSA